MSKRIPEPTQADRLLERVEATLDKLSHLPDAEFRRRHRKALERSRKALRGLQAKLPPPSPTKGRPVAEEAEEKGRQAYELRLQGYAWREVAEATGVLGQRGERLFKIMDWGKRYAERNSLPWPVGPAAPGVRRQGESHGDQ
jgi:hypothetical protein